MSPESAGKVSGAVTVNLTPQEWWDLQQAVKLLQQFEHSVATSLAPKTVNFDTLPNGGAITNGTDLTQNQPYSVWGVKFSVIPGPGPDVPPGGVFAVTAAMRRAAPMSARCSRLRSNRHSLMRRGRSRRRSAFRCMGSRSTSCQPQAARSSAWPRIRFT